MVINERELISEILCNDIEKANNACEELFKEYDAFIEK